MAWDSYVHLDVWCGWDVAILKLAHVKERPPMKVCFSVTARSVNDCLALFSGLILWFHVRDFAPWNPFFSSLWNSEWSKIKIVEEGSTAPSKTWLYTRANTETLTYLWSWTKFFNSLMINEVKHHFVCLLAIWTSL